MKNKADFEISVANFVKKSVPEQYVELRNKIAVDLLNKIIKRTPTDRFDLVNNWQVTLNSPASGEFRSESPLADGVDKILSAKDEDTIWFTNNRIYASVWEYGTFEPSDPGPSRDPRPHRRGKILVSGGFSTQAPEGFVGVSIRELESQYNA